MEGSIPHTVWALQMDRNVHGADKRASNVHANDE